MYENGADGEDILKYHRALEVNEGLMPIKDMITLIDELSVKI